MAGGRDWGEALSRGRVAAGAVVSSIRRLGLEVALDKTEAVVFHVGARSKPPEGLSLHVDTTLVRITREMRYLGLILDDRWRFEGHLAAAANRARARATQLGRLLPNLGGPDDKVRRLYANVVKSVVLYGAPVWAPRLAALRRARAGMAR
ncbi:PREDICTED: uncharacterized protein LOC105560225, partial [Vollenhovia emeryi]|uniref:uncharacterized protein LOC105560225 n=1 Tax=Vollenhovia emeryi TaxID=411798 RepID=UPI0005F39922